MNPNQDKSPRRRFFKLAALSTAAAGMGALGFGALARGRHPGGGPVDPAMLEERLDRMLKHLYVEIDATEAQKQKLDPIVKQAAKELAPLRERAQDARRRGVALLMADTIDRNAIERVREEQMGAADAASKRFTQALTDVAEVLTPEQRKTLAARLQSRGRRGHGRFPG
jgi:Spy/CpxP family protein refolding chaperone